VLAKGLVKAIWSTDANLTTRIDPAVAHYTGQTHLADAIQQGLAAKAAGDDRTATVLLGEAAKLAHDTGNENTTRLLAKVVDLVDVEAGTVRLKQSVDRADEMALDTRSTKTTRIRREP
jgi:von Willebrand factor type A C-terminal domain